MTILRARCNSVPLPTITMLARCLSGGKVEGLMVHFIDFGGVVADALHGGAKMATGNSIFGYHAVDMSLRRTIAWTTNIGLDEQVNIPDLPTFRKLQRISQLMGLAKPEAAVDRLCHWFWTASQIAWFSEPLFIMDHKKEEWRQFRYTPLWNVRRLLEY